LQPKPIEIVDADEYWGVLRARGYHRRRRSCPASDLPSIRRDTHVDRGNLDRDSAATCWPPIHEMDEVPRSIALLISGLIIVTLVASIIYLFCLRMGDELQDILHRVNSAQTTIVGSLRKSDIGKIILSHIQAENLSVTDILARVFRLSSSVIAGVCDGDKRNISCSTTCPLS
jgi:hypothetical protein